MFLLFLNAIFTNFQLIVKTLKSIEHNYSSRCIFSNRLATQPGADSGGGGEVVKCNARGISIKILKMKVSKNTFSHKPISVGNRLKTCSNNKKLDQRRLM